MNSIARLSVATLLIASFSGAVLGQNYPTHKPRPKTSATPRATASPAAGNTTAANSTTAGTTKPTGPLKMIKTDGRNKDSPVKVSDLSYYDSGYGAKYNAEVRVSCTIENSSRADEVKKVTLYLQILDGGGGVVQEWKVPVGTLKRGARYPYNPGVWYNTLGTTLHANVVVEHEEVPKSDESTPKKK